MKVSIGLLAHNEEECIASMLKNIFEQDLFLSVTADVQLVVLANGCTDDTVLIATDTIKKYSHSSFDNKNINIIHIDEAGKSNAWNKYVHEIAWADADYLILLDADIEFGSRNVLSRLVEGLEENPNAVASVDHPRKDIEKHLKKGIFAKISVGVSGVNQNGRSVITGQLYCMRGGAIRSIYMPVGLPVEDGFLRAMVVTGNFTHDDDDSKIIAVNDVCHYFEALLSPSKLYKHEKRLIIGSTINMMVYRYLWKTVSATGKDAGQLIKELNRNDPEWLGDLINDYRSSEGFWIVKARLFLKRMTQLFNGNQKLGKKILLFPVALLATIVSTVIAVDVNCFFKRYNGLGHW